LKVIPVWGVYKFNSDKAYDDYMSTELREFPEMTTHGFLLYRYPERLFTDAKKEGFTRITKQGIIPMAALKVNAAYIKSIKDAGFTDINTENGSPLKALNIDGAYIKEIREAGYKHVTTDQLISFSVLISVNPASLMDLI